MTFINAATSAYSIATIAYERKINNEMKNIDSLVAGIESDAMKKASDGLFSMQWMHSTGDDVITKKVHYEIKERLVAMGFKVDIGCNSLTIKWDHINL